MLYQGVSKESLAFRLMTQMVRALPALLFFPCFFSGRPWISFCFGVHVRVFCVRRGGKKEVGLVRTSRELSRMSVSDNGKTTQVRPRARLRF